MAYAHTYDRRRGVPTAWLLTLTRSRAIDLRRSRRRDPASDPLDAAEHVGTDTPGPEELTAARERQRWVQRALLDLTPEQREVIDLAFYGGLSHSEIAARLAQPLGTVKTRIRLAMLRLRERLAHLTSRAPAVLEEPAP